MMSIDDILDGILRREGGFVNHPLDHGGPTNFGITQATLAAARGRKVTVDDVRSLSEAEARDIYRKRYIAPFDQEPDDVRPQLIDIAVNSGVARAQALYRLAMTTRKARPVGVQLAIERMKFYARLVQHEPALSAFLPGWINRAAEFL